MYTVQYNKFRKEYQVINSRTGLAQSAWNDRAKAHSVANSLNGRN